MNGDFEELYEEWIDHVNSQPLTTSRINQFGDVININQRIINRIYSIRRHLEMTDDDIFDQEYNFSGSFNSFNSLNNGTVENFINIENQLVSNLLNDTGLVGSGENMFGNGIVSRLFSILLEGDVNLDNMEDVKVTLTKEQFDKLFSEKVTQDNETKYKSECNICMDEYKCDDVIVKLGCNHIFHKDCIYNWLCNERVTCPVCRKDTRDDLKDYKTDTEENFNLDDIS